MGAASSPATAGFPGVMPDLALQEEQGHTCALWGLVSSEGRSGVLAPQLTHALGVKLPYDENGFCLKKKIFLMITDVCLFLRGD